MFVYVIVNDVNLKIYIGKTISKNLALYFQKKLWDAEHPESSRNRSYLFAAIRKHGRDHFHVYSLFEGVTNEEICEQEKFLIKTLNSRHPEVGYNICAGGEGHGHTPWNKGKKGVQSHTPETREKISKGMKVLFASGHTNATGFKKGYTSWNKGMKGYVNTGSFRKKE